MKVIFEDSHITPSSILLSKSWIGDSILFSKAGSSKVSELIDEHICENLLIVFYDVVPDNELTVLDYTRLVKEYNSFPNIKILPIACIEYYILYMLAEYGYVKEDTTIQGIMKLESRSVSYSDKTFEKYCKHLLSNLSAKSYCFKNTKMDTRQDTTAKQMYGLFYTHDCPCSFKCRIDAKNRDISTKANQLYSCLPISFGFCSLPFHGDAWNKVEERVKTFYCSLCDALGIEDIKIKVRIK